MHISNGQVDLIACTISGNRASGVSWYSSNAFSRYMSHPWPRNLQNLVCVLSPVGRRCVHRRWHGEFHHVYHQRQSGRNGANRHFDGHMKRSMAPIEDMKPLKRVPVLFTEWRRHLQ